MKDLEKKLKIEFVSNELLKAEEGFLIIGNPEAVEGGNVPITVNVSKCVNNNVPHCGG